MPSVDELPLSVLPLLAATATSPGACIDEISQRSGLTKSGAWTAVQSLFKVGVKAGSRESLELAAELSGLVSIHFTKCAPSVEADTKGDLISRRSSQMLEAAKICDVTALGRISMKTASITSTSLGGRLSQIIGSDRFSWAHLDAAVHALRNSADQIDTALNSKSTYTWTETSATFSALRVWAVVARDPNKSWAIPELAEAALIDVGTARSFVEQALERGAVWRETKTLGLGGYQVVVRPNANGMKSAADLAASTQKKLKGFPGLMGEIVDARPIIGNSSLSSGKLKQLDALGAIARIKDPFGLVHIQEAGMSALNGRALLMRLQHDEWIRDSLSLPTRSLKRPFRVTEKGAAALTRVQVEVELQSSAIIEGRELLAHSVQQRTPTHSTEREL